MNVKRTPGLLTLPLLTLLVGLAACSSPPAEEAKPAEPAAAAPSTPPPSAPRAYFAEPADGATVTSPVKLKFASEGITISAVPEGEITTVRPGMGHYHFAIDVDCLGPGEEIKKGEKWVHLGKGDTEIDTQLGPGSHKLTVAVADDKHIQVAGLCSTITVTAK